jgi:acetyl-CoA synthetase
MAMITPIAQRWLSYARILDRDLGDITTIEEDGSIEEARPAWQQIKAEIGH